MVGQVSVHDDHKVTLGMFESFPVGRPQPQLLFSFDDDLSSIKCTILLNILVSCFAMPKVPSGLLSSMMMISILILLNIESLVLHR